MFDSSNTAARPSPFRRLLKFGFFGMVILILLALLAVAFENWRGRRAWEKFRAEWEAKGEQFDITAWEDSRPGDSKYQGPIQRW